MRIVKNNLEASIELTKTLSVLEKMIKGKNILEITDTNCLLGIVSITDEYDDDEVYEEINLLTEKVNMTINHLVVAPHCILLQLKLN